VELLGGGGHELKPPPGRDLVVGPAHTFAELAEAIDDAFARWDRAHLSEFTLADGRLVGWSNSEYDEPETVRLDPEQSAVAREAGPGDVFE
jgi:hypothetical protein